MSLLSSITVPFAIGPVPSDRFLLGKNGSLPLFEEQTLLMNKMPPRKDWGKRKMSFQMNVKLPNLHEVMYSP